MTDQAVFNVPRAGTDPQGTEPVLAIEALQVSFPGGAVAVRDASFAICEGEIVGLAGQSGSGKTVSALAAIGLLPPTAMVQGSVRYRGRELVGMSEAERARLRGREITMVFQETTTALNPVIRIGRQLLLAVHASTEASKDEALDRVRRGLRDVGLEEVDRVMASYPHELSGGMCQRVMIAMALSCGASLIIADEPTTALDVSVQKEVIDVVRRLSAEHGVAVLFVSHDLGVLDELCNRIVVMYDGEVVETGPAHDIVEAPYHPYTAALLESLPRLDGKRAVRRGPVAQLAHLRDDQSCRFLDRCPAAMEQCRTHPVLEADATGREVRCWLREVSHP